MVPEGQVLFWVLGFRLQCALKVHTLVMGFYRQEEQSTERFSDVPSDAQPAELGLNQSSEAHQALILGVLREGVV